MIWKEEIVAQLSGTLPAFAWKDWGKPRKISNQDNRSLVEIWTWDLTNTKQGVNHSAMTFGGRDWAVKEFYCGLCSTHADKPHTDGGTAGLGVVLSDLEVTSIYINRVRNEFISSEIPLLNSETNFWVGETRTLSGRHSETNSFMPAGSEKGITLRNALFRLWPSKRLRASEMFLFGFLVQGLATSPGMTFKTI
jgi:hypothetical protein